MNAFAFLAANPHPAGWSRAARAGLLLLVALLCGLSGLVLYVEERSALRVAATHHRLALQTELRSALAKAAALPALRRDEGALGMRLAAAEEALWPNGGEANALLQAKLSRRAEECGLSLTSFKPLAATGAAGASVSNADISVTGNYAQLLRFVELISASPRPVLIDALDIIRTEHDGIPTLLMNATVSVIRDVNNKGDTP